MSVSSALEKFDKVAQRAAMHHGLNVEPPVTAIYGTGSFFKGVAACEPGLVIVVANGNYRRWLAFEALCVAGWKEWRQRWLDANANKKSVFNRFETPDNRARRSETMAEPCEWAVHEWCARAGTANPLVLERKRSSGGEETANDDLRQLFAPLADEAIAEVLSG